MERNVHREGCREPGRERQREIRKRVFSVKSGKEERHSWPGDSHREKSGREEREREREERRRRWKEEAARPNMAAILCIPVVDGEVGKQARPQRQLSMPVISRNAPQRSEYFVFLIRAPR